MSGATLNLNGWQMVLATNDPNPVVATRDAGDGGTARLYANGLVDAVDGKLYSLSPGFDSYSELNDWIENGEIQYSEWAAECFATVGAIWLENGTLAGWRLSMDVDAEADYCATQLGRYLSDEDEVIDHE